MRRSRDGDGLDERVIEALREGEAELTAIADEADAAVGPVFVRVRQLVDEGAVRSPRPGVYALTGPDRSPSPAEPAGSTADRD